VRVIFPSRVTSRTDRLSFSLFIDTVRLVVYCSATSDGSFLSPSMRNCIWLSATTLKTTQVCRRVEVSGRSADRESCVVVRWQHQYFGKLGGMQLHRIPTESSAGYPVPIAITFGIVLPTVLGAAFGDVIVGFIYPGLVARLLSAFWCLLWMTDRGDSME